MMMLFLNVNYPLNLEIFLGFFKVGAMNFIPNPLSWIMKDYDERGVYSPPKFKKYEFDGSFLKTCGHLLFVLSLVCIIHVLSSMRSNKISKLIRERLGLNLAFQIFVATSHVLLLSLMLQLVEPDFSDVFNSFSWLLAFGLAISFCLVSSFIILVHYRIKKAESMAAKLLIEKYEVLFKGFINNAQKLPKPFLTIIFVRKIMSMLFLVTVYDYIMP